jgi:hypothetical protein
MLSSSVSVIKPQPPFSAGSCRGRFPKQSVFSFYPASPVYSSCQRLLICPRWGQRTTFQPLYNQHLHPIPAGVHSIPLTDAKSAIQPLQNQHLRPHLASAENKQLIIPFLATLPQFSPTNPFGMSTYTKTGGGPQPYIFLSLSPSSRERAAFCLPRNTRHLFMERDLSL